MGELRERHVESGNAPREDEEAALVITPRRADRGKDAWLFLAASTVIEALVWGWLRIFFFLSQILMNAKPLHRILILIWGVPGLL